MSDDIDLRPYDLDSELELASTMWVRKTTRNMLGDVPAIPTSQPSEPKLATDLDLVALAILALFSAKDAQRQRQEKYAYQVLHRSRKGAYIGVERNIPELGKYFNDLFKIINRLPRTQAEQSWGETVKAMLRDQAYTVLIRYWPDVSLGFSKRYRHCISEIVQDISGCSEFADYLIPEGAFGNCLEEKAWLEKRLEICQRERGFAHETTKKCAFRLSKLLLKGGSTLDQRKAMALLDKGFEACQGSLDMMESWADARFRLLKENFNRTEMLISVCKDMIKAYDSLSGERFPYKKENWEENLYKILKETRDYGRLVEFSRDMLAERSSHRDNYLAHYDGWVEKLYAALQDAEDIPGLVQLSQKELATEPEYSRESHYNKWSTRLPEALRQAGDF
jgi:hypothetical protein